MPQFFKFTGTDGKIAYLRTDDVCLVTDTTIELDADPRADGDSPAVLGMAIPALVVYLSGLVHEAGWVAVTKPEEMAGLRMALGI